MRRRLPSRYQFMAVLLFAFAVRAVLAFVSLGSDHPNETYRLLEPLAAFEGYATRLPWEWKDGLLSTLPARAQYLLIAPWQASPYAQLVMLKLAYALLSLLPVVATWRLLKRGSHTSSAFALIGVTFVAFWPEFIYRSVRLMDYSLEAGLLALAIILALTVPKTSAFGRYATVAAGVVLGAAFFVRFQSGLYLVALGFALLAFPTRPTVGPRQSTGWRDVALLFLGYGVTVAALASVESALTGDPFLSPFLKYVHFNWAEDGAARFYGTAPWHRYLSETAKAYGYLPCAIFLLAAVRSVFVNRQNGTTEAATVRSVAVIFFLPLLVLSLLAHKEGRFVFGFLWLLVPLAFSSSEFSDLVTESLSRHRAALAKNLMIVILVIGLGINLDRVSRRVRTGADEVREWIDLGDRIATMRSDALVALVKADPDAVPGGFFLRLHGSLCYRYFRDGKPQQQGGCDGADSPNIVISRDSGSPPRWQLIPLR